MTTDEIVENIVTSVSTISTKLHMVSWAFSCCVLDTGFLSFDLDWYSSVCLLLNLSFKQKGKSIKVIHLKSHTSVALPIYASDLSHLKLLEEEMKKARLAKASISLLKLQGKKSHVIV